MAKSRDDVKKYLNQYRDAACEIKRINALIKTLERDFDCIPSVTDYDGMPHGSNIGHPTEVKAIDAADKWRKYKWQIEQLKDIQFSVICTIEDIKYPYGDILKLKYIDGYTLAMVADCINYSESYVKELHGLALDMVDVSKHPTSSYFLTTNLMI